MEGIDELNNEIAIQRQHENRCATCNDTGIIHMHVPVAFSNGELFEDYDETCPVCNEKSKKEKVYTLRFPPGENVPQPISKEVLRKVLSRRDYDGCTNQEISDELKSIRLGLSSAFFPNEKEVILQAEKRLTRKD